MWQKANCAELACRLWSDYREFSADRIRIFLIWNKRRSVGPRSACRSLANQCDRALLYHTPLFEVVSSIVFFSSADWMEPFRTPDCNHWLSVRDLSQGHQENKMAGINLLYEKKAKLSIKQSRVFKNPCLITRSFKDVRFLWVKAQSSRKKTALSK